MKETLLIVDDEERILDLISIYLKKENYNVIKAFNGLEAIKIFNNEKIDLIILDVMMPIMDGWDVCKEIRKNSDVPIIMLTAKAEEDDELIGFQLGIDHYVTKPFSPKTLIARVKAIIRRTNSSTSTSDNTKDLNNINGICIDKLCHKVSIDNIEINLSPKEFELLHYLILNKGIVLTREKILDTLWGIDYLGDLRTVDTAIKRLREKIGSKSYLISTIRGVGYRFEVKNEK
ncbi:response regulator transcription factor [Haloimpatiens sp. FM7315]|uniref:response regulator transcription factor n=1 Tax=Haloimpatiens sp. FM7315 TaxID=3298609 RepID=UPI0035A2E1F2